MDLFAKSSILRPLQLLDLHRSTKQTTTINRTDTTMVTISNPTINKDINNSTEVDEGAATIQLGTSSCLPIKPHMEVVVDTAVGPAVTLATTRWDTVVEVVSHITITTVVSTQEDTAVLAVVMEENFLLALMNRPRCRLLECNN